MLTKKFQIIDCLLSFNIISLEVSTLLHIYIIATINLYCVEENCYDSWFVAKIKCNAVLCSFVQSRQILSSSMQDLPEKWMQHWMEIHLVTLQKQIETMPQRTCAVLKATGGATKISYVTFFFLARQYRIKSNHQVSINIIYNNNMSNIETFEKMCFKIKR